MWVVFDECAKHDKMIVCFPVFRKRAMSLFRAFRDKDSRVTHDVRVCIGEDGMKCFVPFSIVECNDSFYL